MTKVKTNGYVWGLVFNQYVHFSFYGKRFVIRYNELLIWPWKFKVKVMTQVNHIDHIWRQEFNRYVCF